MLFIDWRSLAIFLGLCLILLIPVAAMGAVRKRTLWVSVPVGIGTVSLGLMAMLALFVFLLGNMSGCQAFDSPVYSPDGKSAARIEHYDAGATGGGTSVVLYTDHGFRTKTVFSGGFRSVDPTNLKWAGNSDLVIRYDHYDGYNEASTCSGIGDIRVRCEAKPGPGR